MRTGELVSTILKAAKETQADLIIIKKAKRMTNGRRFLKQENADRLIANSVCPVLTIYKKPTSEGIHKILLPVDITKKTDNKVAWAKSIAKRFGAEIHIVSVMNMKLMRVNSLSYKKGRRIKYEIGKDGIKAKLVLLDKGDKLIEDVVLSYARNNRPDLLLIMTHQENFLFDNYLGSFAREMIHRAEMPVFSVVPSRENLVGGFIDSVADLSISGKRNAKPVKVEKKKQESYK
jgi:nucleotide-binding universal stress UspA family protein